MQHLSTALIALLLSSVEVPTGPGPVELPSSCVEPAEPTVTTSTARKYLLRWDDSLDGDLERSFKQCVVELERFDRVLTGRFVGPVLGEARTAAFTGEAIGRGSRSGPGDLWMLQQREPGYVCSYQLSPSTGGSWTGTWRDSRGRAGTVRLRPAPVDPILVRATHAADAVRRAACIDR